MRVDETPAAELWSRTLAQIRSYFGRLAYLASLRDANTGVYGHFGFAQRFTEKVVDKTIARSHQNVFADWLCLSLEQQKDDIEAYLETLETDRRTVLKNWQELSPYMSWIPATARKADRELFRLDLEIVTDLIRREANGVSIGQTA